MTRQAGTSVKMKLTKACQNCRSKKLRCPGDLPCQRCVKDGLVCKYPPTKPSQNAAYLEKVKQQEEMIEELQRHNYELKSQLKNAMFLPQKTCVMEQEVEQSVLHVDHNFVEYFFDYLYVHAPLFHRPTLTAYLKSNDSCVPEFLRLALTAFVSHFASRDPFYPYLPKPTEYDAQEAFRKAKNAVLKHYDVVSIEMVQSFALMSRASVAGGNLDLGWIFSGLMLRMATLLSLNWETEKTIQTKTDIQIEVERRTWWVVVIIVLQSYFQSLCLV